MDRNQSDIFCLKDEVTNTNNHEDSNTIYSVAGSPSFRINRKPEHSTVFPAGIQGSQYSRRHAEEMADDAGGDDMHEEYDGTQQNDDGGMATSRSVEELARPASHTSLKPPKVVTPVSRSAMTRNPLTGEGMDQVDESSQRRHGLGRKATKWTW